MSKPFARAMRRAFALAVLAALSAPDLALAPAQTPAKEIGVFALLGEGVQVASSGDETIGTWLDRNQSDSINSRDIGLDEAVLRGMQSVVERLQPSTQLALFRATAPINIKEERTVAEGAHRNELPA